MAKQNWSVANDRHLNLFYTYQTRHLEDNVTRALVLVLQSLAPVHLRLFLRDIVLQKPAQRTIRERMSMLAENEFEFDLQVRPPDESGDLLDETNGIIVGVNYSGRQLPNFDTTNETLGGARPDALVADVANEVTAIFEIKLADTLYEEQIQRHLKAFFVPGTRIENVFVEITWSDIAKFLQRVRRQSAGDRERFVTLEFVQYLDWLNLIEFFGFDASDFKVQQDGLHSEVKLNKFITQLKFGPEFGLKDYDNDGKLWFTDIPHENIWVELTEQGINFGIICGSGKMWRARNLRDYIEAKPNAFRKMLVHLRKSIDARFPIVLRVHSYFRHSRFRTAWLGDINGMQPFPSGYDNFVATLTNRNLNAFEQVPKKVIQQRFAASIEQNLQSRFIEVDAKGQFPKWEEIDSFLQYSYFHVDVQIPSSSLIGQSIDDLLVTLRGVLEAEHEMMRAMNAI